MTVTPSSVAPPATDAQRRFVCRHIHAKGNRCGSPALRGRNFCYFHDRTRREVPSSRIGTFEMPRVDDRAAIQIALFEVLARLASGDIDYKRGTSILYGLQIASSNLRNDLPAADAPPVVEEVVNDLRLGDLAPIAEFPEPQPATSSLAPATPTPEPTTAPTSAIKPISATAPDTESPDPALAPSANPHPAFQPTQSALAQLAASASVNLPIHPPASPRVRESASWACASNPVHTHPASNVPGMEAYE